MNETELKMIDYMQGIIDYAKSLREEKDYGTDELLHEMCRLSIDAFNHCAQMFSAVTGKSVTRNNWKVVVKGE